MAMQRVIWIPWAAGSCECDFFARSAQWNTAKKGAGKDGKEKQFIIVSYAKGVRAPALANLIGVDCQVYLRGHGVPGDPGVNPTNTANNPNGIHIRESIDRLIEMGLQPTFRGKVKFYSCFSGLEGADRKRKVDSVQRKYGFGKLRFGEKVLKSKWIPIARPEGTWDPLAMRGATYMRSLGFNMCKFYGYMGVCSGEMQNEGEDDGKAHKHVQPMVVNKVTGIREAAGAEGRASAFRQEF